MSKFLSQSSLLYSISIAGFAFSIAAFWPGFMEYDSFDQYGQATGSLTLDDWHPVGLTLLWKALNLIYRGPQVMLLLQSVLYWSGFLYLSLYLLRRSSNLILSLGAVVIPFSPFLINFSGAILKDTHLAISLFWASLLLGLGEISSGKLLISFFLILYALSVRHNAIAAALPIIILWSYQFAHLASVKNKLGVPIITVIFFLGYLVASTFFASLLAIERTSPLKAQMLNDITFIQCQSDSENMDILKIYYGIKLNSLEPHSRRKYLCDQISILANTGDTGAIYDDGALEAPDIQDHHIVDLWIQSIKSHPLLYLEYRFMAYKTFLRPFSYPDPYYVFLDGIEENPFSFNFPFDVLNPAGLTTILKDYVIDASTSKYTQIFFRPFFWLSMIMLTTLLALIQRNIVVFLVSVSGLLYLILYLIFIPAPDFRYCYYSIFAQILSIFLWVYQTFRSKPTQAA